MEQKERPVIASYVFYSGEDGDRVFRVSTIYRRSSISDPGVSLYPETAVWECDPSDHMGKWGDMILCRGGGLDYHAELCRHLFRHGELPEEEIS